MWRAVLAGVLVASPAIAGDMLFPVDCTLGEDCFIQQYVDRNPGPGVADFTCGPLAYNNHQGTDFRLKNRAALARPYSALAAAPAAALVAPRGQMVITLLSRCREATMEIE